MKHKGTPCTDPQTTSAHIALNGSLMYAYRSRRYSPPYPPTQAHRETFEYLINEFKTYNPIMSAIQNEYEMYIGHLQETVSRLKPLEVCMYRMDTRTHETPTPTHTHTHTQTPTHTHTHAHNTHTLQTHTRMHTHTHTHTQHTHYRHTHACTHTHTHITCTHKHSTHAHICPSTHTAHLRTHTEWTFLCPLSTYYNLVSCFPYRLNW